MIFAQDERAISKLLKLVHIIVLIPFFTIPLAGCADAIYRPGDEFESYAPPVPVRFPYHVGVYFTNEFRTYQKTYNYGSVDHHFEVGPASVSMFDALTRSIFWGVDKVDGLSELPSAQKDIDFVIQFDKIEFELLSGNYSVDARVPHVARVSYDIKLLTLSGGLVTTFYIRGDALGADAYMGPPTFVADPNKTTMMESAMAEARDSFAAEFYHAMHWNPPL